MTLILCHQCSKAISMSILPGGNPIARAQPDFFALRYGRCQRCGRVYCDRCITAAGDQCPGCGRPVAIEGPQDSG
jgi:hypothetical protein